MKKVNKKDKRRFFIWSLLIIIIISYLVVFSYNYWSQILKNNREKNKLQTEYKDLLATEDELNSEITKLQDPDYVAKYAREKYMYSKNGEYIIRIPETTTTVEKK
jgi:cell division protein DivIC